MSVSPKEVLHPQVNAALESYYRPPVASQLTRIEQGLDSVQLWLKRIMEGIGPGLLPDNFKELSHRLECLSAQIKGGQDGIAVEIASLRGMIERRCTGTTVHINRQLLRQLVKCAKPFKKAKPKKGRR